MVGDSGVVAEACASWVGRIEGGRSRIIGGGMWDEGFEERKGGEVNNDEDKSCDQVPLGVREPPA